MEKRLGINSRSIVLTILLALAIAVAALWWAAPHVALAGESETAGIVISLGEPIERSGGKVIYEVSSYRAVSSGEIVNLDDPFTVTVPDTAR
ncbi:hypothetical protein [Collinsella intestinalis]|uniref:hypothetical protein n=1 Tax=Collinsella intestinalis TaxID=147207 RepID=UPI00195AE49A|nr:hypothetical protein [Collinsella intestinalis]MBM6907426.1 hypothetical protein [Collinsella intestinalis]MBM6942596.1 hypothetical protein [Collinsella intestinalis]